MSRTLDRVSQAIETSSATIAFEQLAARWLGHPAPAWTEAVPLKGADPLTPLYAKWLHHHARIARHQAGTWYTPPALAQAVAGQVPSATETPRVLDPAVGTGEFLLAAAARWPRARLEGWDCDPTALAIARARLARAGRTATLILGDSLAAPRPGPVDVIVGNPPWWRAPGGGFVTAGHPEVGGGRPLFDDVRAGVPGMQAKNAYNHYVYFWRLCLWQAFEQQVGPAAVALVTPASLLDGPAFAGLRALLRRADLLSVVVLGGDGRAGARRSALRVRTPACVTLAAKTAEAPQARIAHDPDFSFDFNALAWSPLAPAGALATPREARGWPLDAVFPWIRSGVKPGRTWPIAPEKAQLEDRWRCLLAATGEARRVLFKPSPSGRDGDAVVALPADAPCPPIVPYAWRTFDRQWLLLDPTLLDRSAEPLWAAHGPAQRCLTTGAAPEGPAASLTADVPDLHHFSGRGARDVIPLWQADGRPNLHPEVVAALAAAHGEAPGPADVFWYAVAVLAQPGHGARLGAELGLPLTASRALFQAGVALGQRLDETPTGRARCVVPVRHPAAPVLVGDVLQVGDGRFAEISREVMDFQMGSLPVARHFITHRLGWGRTSSALDGVGPWTESTSRALLETLWKIEHLLALAPELAAWLDAVLAERLVPWEAQSLR